MVLPVVRRDVQRGVVLAAAVESEVPAEEQAVGRGADGDRAEKQALVGGVGQIHRREERARRARLDRAVRGVDLGKGMASNRGNGEELAGAAARSGVGNQFFFAREGVLHCCEGVERRADELHVDVGFFGNDDRVGDQKAFLADMQRGKVPSHHGRLLARLLREVRCLIFRSREYRSADPALGLMLDREGNPRR